MSAPEGPSRQRRVRDRRLSSGPVFGPRPRAADRRFQTGHGGQFVSFPPLLMPSLADTMLLREESLRTGGDKIGLGGGCHWCTEGIFQMLQGMAQVEQGFIRSDPPSDTWAEGVIVHFNPSVSDLSTSVAVHLRTHEAGAPYKADSKYRSAIYVYDQKQRKQATDAVSSLQEEFESAPQTRALLLRGFKLST